MKDERQQMSLFAGDLLDGPVSTTIVLLGAIGNIYCVRVLQSKPMHERMKMNLLCLALTDLLLMITLLGYYSFEATLRFSGINKFQFDLLTVRLHGVAELANTASVQISSAFFSISVFETRGSQPASFIKLH